MINLIAMLTQTSKTIHKAFSLIEVVIAVIIIMLFLGSLVGLFNVNSKNIVISRHRLQASNLARGAADLARATRDTVWENGFAWSTLTTDCWLPITSGAQFDYVVYDSSRSIPYSACYFTETDGSKVYHPGFRILTDENQAKVTFATDDGTVFARKIKINTIGPAASPTDILKVTVYVYWTDFGQQRTVKMEEYLTNWKK